MAVLLVVISGCPQQSLGASEGIKIKSFGFDPSTISDKDQAELSISLENVGAFDSPNVNFFIYGYDTDVWAPGIAEVSMGSASGDTWTIPDFQGYVMDTGQPGFSADYTQLLKVDEGWKVAKGITQNFGFNGRLCYQYETRAVAKVNAISLSQRRDEKDKGMFSDGGILVKNSFAPIQIEVKTKSPIVFYNSNDVPTAEIVLIIKNAGSGYPAATGCSQDVTVTDVNRLEDAGLLVMLDDKEFRCDETYSFYDGQAIVYCDVSLDQSERPKGEYTLSVTAKYYYYNDVKASVSVIGTSNEVVVTPSGSSGGGPTTPKKVYKGGTCEDLCKSVANQKANFKGLAVCSDKDAVDYPGTDVPVLLKSVNQYSTEIGTLVGQGSVSLEDLKLHDVTVDDINLRQLPVNDLNKAGMSKQYTEKTFYVDSDGDGLPNEWETQFIGLDPNKRDSDKDSISDGAETCSQCTGGPPCDSTKTFKANYDLKCKQQAYYDTLTLGLTGSLTEAKVTSTANPTIHSISGTESVDGMRIVGIGDKTIAEMTGKSSNTKIKAITYIDVGKLDLVKMGVSIPPLFKMTRCKNPSTYNEDIACGCVVDLGTGYGPYPSFESGTATPCNTKCINLGVGYDGGRCIALSEDDDGYRCSSSSLIIYRMKISTDTEKYGCSTACTCYDVLKTMSAAERQLRCS